MKLIIVLKVLIEHWLRADVLTTAVLSQQLSFDNYPTYSYNEGATVPTSYESDKESEIGSDNELKQGAEDEDNSSDTSEQSNTDDDSTTEVIDIFANKDDVGSNAESVKSIEEDRKVMNKALKKALKVKAQTT